MPVPGTTLALLTGTGHVVSHQSCAHSFRSQRGSATVSDVATCALRDSVLALPLPTSTSDNIDTEKCVQLGSTYPPLKRGRAVGGLRKFCPGSFPTTQMCRGCWTTLTDPQSFGTVYENTTLYRTMPQKVMLRGSFLDHTPHS